MYPERNIFLFLFVCSNFRFALEFILKFLTDLQMSILLSNRKQLLVHYQRLIHYIQHIYFSKSFLLLYSNVYALVHGQKKSLYFFRILARIQRVLPHFSNLLILCVRFYLFTYHYGVLNFRLLILVICHFIQTYKDLFILRICLDYLQTNPYEAPPLIRAIYDFTEHGMRLFEVLLPRGFLRTILMMSIYEILATNIVPHVAHVLEIYGRSSFFPLAYSINKMLPLFIDEEIVYT